MATPKFAIRNGDNLVGIGWECASGRMAITYTGEQINVKCPIEVTDLNHNPIVDIDILDLVMWMLFGVDHGEKVEDLELEFRLWRDVKYEWDYDEPVGEVKCERCRCYTCHIGSCGTRNCGFCDDSRTEIRECPHHVGAEKT